MRGDRERPREISVLDAIMVGTVAVAGLVLLLWFVFLAGSPLPS
jgi:hypothetical protein